MHAEVGPAPDVGAAEDLPTGEGHEQQQACLKQGERGLADCVGKKTSILHMYTFLMKEIT